MPKVKPVNFSIPKVQQQIRQNEIARGNRVRELLQREPDAAQYFGDDKLYNAPQIDIEGNANPKFESDTEAAINYGILENKLPDATRYKNVAPLNTVGDAVAKGQTYFEDPEMKADALRIMQYRRTHGGQ